MRNVSCPHSQSRSRSSTVDRGTNLSSFHYDEGGSRKRWFAAAARYFHEHPDAIKWRRGRDVSWDAVCDDFPPYSFFNTETHGIVCVPGATESGIRGSYAHAAKKAYNADGNCVGFLKSFLYGYGVEFAALPEVVANQSVHRAGCFSRPAYNGDPSDNKGYILAPYLGIDVVKFINDNPDLRDDPQALVNGITYVAQILRALIDIHAKDIVHCDIKPGNIVIAGDGRVSIIDFGMSSIDSNRGCRRVGWNEYAAPECIARSAGSVLGDIYSTGMVSILVLMFYCDNALFGAFCGLIQPIEFSRRLKPSVILLESAKQIACNALQKISRLSPRLVAMLISMIDYNPAKRPAAPDVLAVIEHERVRLSGSQEVSAVALASVLQNKDIPGPEKSAGSDTDPLSSSADSLSSVPG